MAAATKLAGTSTLASRDRAPDERPGDEPRPTRQGCHGTDDAVAELQAGLAAGLREDRAVGVRGMPWDQVPPGRKRSTVADLLFVILGWRAYVALVLESGWTDEQYIAGIAETLTHLLLPDETS